MSQLSALEWLLLASVAILAISFLVGRMKVYQDRLLAEIRAQLDDVSLRRRAAAQLQQRRETRRERVGGGLNERRLREQRMLARQRASEIDAEGKEATVSTPSRKVAE